MIAGGKGEHKKQKKKKGGEERTKSRHGDAWETMGIPISVILLVHATETGLRSGRVEHLGSRATLPFFLSSKLRP